MCCCFFFQAEDGIRDLVRSRGLGDVYKRQELDHVAGVVSNGLFARRGADVLLLGTKNGVRVMAVSYTHLTLPTSDLV